MDSLQGRKPFKGIKMELGGKQETLREHNLEKRQSWAHSVTEAKWQF